MTIYQPYTYLIGWSILDKWYYGVRFATKHSVLYETGCHPDDLWVTYFTSCNRVHHMREKYGEPDIVQVRKTFECPTKAQQWEIETLRRLQVISDHRWLNVGIPGVLEITDEFRTAHRRSKPKPPGFGERVSRGRKGMVLSNQHRDNIRKARLGTKQSQATKKKRKETLSKLRWWNNGITSCRKYECPGDGWVLGRIGWKS